MSISNAMAANSPMSICIIIGDFVAMVMEFDLGDLLGLRIDVNYLLWCKNRETILFLILFISFFVLNPARV